MTLDQLIQLCVTEVKTDPNKKIWNDSTWTNYINQSIRRIEKDGNYEWQDCAGEGTVSLTGSTQEYDLPSDFIKLEYITLGNAEVLTKTDKIQVLKYGNTSNSKPTSYYIRGRKVGFWATPDKSYTATILYRKSIPLLSNAAPDLGFADNFADAIVKYAAYLAWSSPRGNEQTAQSKFNDYQLALESLRTSDLFNDMASMTFVNSRGGRPYNAQVIYD